MGRVEVSLAESTPSFLRPLLNYGARTNRWWVNFYLPPGSRLQRLLENGSETTGGSGTWEERPFASVFVEAPLGGTATAGVEWLAPIPESGSVTVALPATVSQPAEELAFEVPPVEGCG